MIDLHSHILPGVDDGPNRIEESLAMALAYAADGTNTVVATPHVAVEGPAMAEIRGWVEVVRAELARRAVPVELLPGGELNLATASGALPERSRLPLLNGSRYLLVELPPDLAIPFAEEVLFRLQIESVVPVIAHPERLSCLEGRPEALEQLVARGMLAQLTCGSLLGEFGRQVRSRAEELLTRRLVHVLASDAHSATRRPPGLTRALERAAELIGWEEAMAMVTSTPRAILDDEDVVPSSPLPPRRRSWFAPLPRHR